MRDLLHVRDVVDLYLAAEERSEQLAGQVFNVGGGVANSLSLLELFGRLEQGLADMLAWAAEMEGA